MKANFILVAGALALVAADHSALAADLLADPVEVVAKRLDEARSGILPETGSSIYRLNDADIADMPQGAATPLNQVLLRAPGWQVRRNTLVTIWRQMLCDTHRRFP